MEAQIHEKDFWKYTTATATVKFWLGELFVTFMIQIYEALMTLLQEKFAPCLVSGKRQINPIYQYSFSFYAILRIVAELFYAYMY